VQDSGNISGDNTVKEFWRLGKIIRILIKHGFGNIAERLFKRTETSTVDQEEKE
jgi:hypothetical protein